MFSKPLALGLLALGCVTAAAGGAYLATRHNAAEAGGATQAPGAMSSTAAQPGAVAETEAPVAAPQTKADEAPSAPSTTKRDDAKRTQAVAPAKPAKAAPAPRSVPSAKTAPPDPIRQQPVARRTAPVLDSGVPAQSTDAAANAAPTAPPLAPVDPPRVPDVAPERPRTPQFEELVLPAASVIGLQVETALSSERARIEDRVDARVTRDVMADGHVAIPAGSRVLGSVTLVDRGGKLKERARLGIRFHTLVLADGSEVPLNTEPFYRDGDSPSGESAKKIGGAAAVGAILGGILGGGKGAVVGGTTGAAGGTAMVMAGDRNPATVNSGSIVTVRLSSPVTIQVEKRAQ
jgi:hypothetical protein